MKFLCKFPNRQEFLPVFSLILFIVFSWTIYRMLFQIPSWLYSHTKAGIFFLATYVFAFALIESLLLIGFILLVNLILPRRIFRNQFVAAGSLVVITCTIWALILLNQSEGFGRSNLLVLSAWVLLFLFTIVLISIVSNDVFQRYNRVRSAIETVADRMIIFAWLYIPVGVVSLIVVVLRNLI